MTKTRKFVLIVIVALVGLTVWATGTAQAAANYTITPHLSVYGNVDGYIVTLDGPGSLQASWTAPQSTIYAAPLSAPCAVTQVGTRSTYQTGIVCTGAATVTVYLGGYSYACGTVNTLSLDGTIIFTDTRPACVPPPPPTPVATVTYNGNTIIFANPTGADVTLYATYNSTSPSVTFTGDVTVTVQKVISGRVGHRTTRYVYNLAATVPAGGVTVAVAQ